MIMRLAAIVAVALLTACATTPAPSPQPATAPAPAPIAQTPHVRMTTNAGDLILLLDPSAAPQTVAQFLRLVNAGVYDSIYFYRVERGFVAQTATESDRAAPLTAEQRAIIKPIPLETNALRHTRGVLSLAHGDDPNSGTTSFSILLGDAPHLDGKFTIFGRLESDFILGEIERTYDQHARDANGERLQIVHMAVEAPR